MSTKTEDGQKSQNQQQANDQATANQAPDQNTQQQDATKIVEQPALTDEEKIGRMVAGIAKENPNLTPDQVSDIVAKIYRKSDADKIETKIDKEAARLIPTPPTPDDDDRIFFKKDKDRRFPLHKSALDNIVCRQTYDKVTEDGDPVNVPAKNLNEIGVYTKEEFERHSKPVVGAFDRQKVTIQVWHEPGQKDTVQD